MQDLPYGTVYTPNGLLSGLWALPRPLTAHWGQGDELMKRMTQLWGPFDVVFGKQDTVDGHGVSVDSDPESNPDVLSDWSDMPPSPTGTSSRATGTRPTSATSARTGTSTTTAWTPATER